MMILAYHAILRLKNSLHSCLVCMTSQSFTEEERGKSFFSTCFMMSTSVHDFLISLFIYRLYAEGEVIK